MDTRRRFLKSAAAGALGSFLPGLAMGDVEWKCEGDHLTLRSSLVHQPTRFLIAGDTHLAIEDDRDAEYFPMSKRMAQWPGNPKKFQKMIRKAEALHVDGLAILGDLVSFPAQAGIEFCYRELSASKVKWMYIAGNHDWHYEGVPGTDDEQRAKWISRLLPLYQGRDPMMYVEKIKGFRLVFIDNSTYQISEKQLAFYREQVATGDPLIVLCHIPLYFEGVSYDIAQCGHPQWGAATDGIWQIERRQKWPAGGATATTRTFCKEVFETPTLLGSFAGHIHVKTFSPYGDKRFMMTTPVATGGLHLDVLLLPKV